MTSDTQYDAGVDHMLYVEGILPGSGFIRVNWSKGSEVRPNADQVRITVFSWFGPLNVPGHSIYNYTADGAALGAGMSKWITPNQGGSLFFSTEDSGAAVDSSDIVSAHHSQSSAVR